VTASARADAPLAGVRVLDLTRLLPGAYATSLLVDLGADVVKVEDPRGGDGLRAAPPWTASGESGLFVALCRGKRSVALDLKDPAGRDALLALVAGSHVLLDSFRPGVLDRLGLGPAELEAANPALVHVSLTAYGDGTRAALPGHDLNAEGFAGLLGPSRGADGSVSLPSVPMADLATGLQAALAVVSGLRVADGFRADVSMLDSAMSLAIVDQGAVLATGADGPVPGMLTGGLACYGVYRCADGLEVVLAPIEPRFFARFAELAGAPDLVALQYDIAGQDALRGRLTALFAEHPRAHWLALLEHDQTCVSPVRTVAEALADPDLAARGVLSEAALADGSPRTVAKAAPWAPGDPARGRGAPGLGAHTDEVLAGLGSDPSGGVGAHGPDGAVGPPS
jgi:crotonobetainyl-CoA:carnitine CoA-transferase CaiB-like acyl-CoA transferase